jgi:hypothetical protein
MSESAYFSVFAIDVVQRRAAWLMQTSLDFFPLLFPSPPFPSLTPTVMLNSLASILPFLHLNPYSYPSVASILYPLLLVAAILYYTILSYTILSYPILF